MGVHGLWQLLQPVARPIALETMGNKRLAIDSSIWLYQFQLAMRDKEGRALDNAHILGFLRRITKLLFYGIKPVFVFDGGAPVIKRIAISERKKRKRGGADNLAKTAEKLLAAQLRAAAVDEAQKRSGQERRAVDGSGALIGDDTVYLEDFGPTDLAPTMIMAPRRGMGDAPQNINYSTGEPEGSPPKKKKKYVHKDQYELPKLDQSLHERAQEQIDLDPRMATEEELREFIDDLKPEDFDMDSEVFANLPTELKYEIIGDLRIKSRQTNRRRVEAMKNLDTPLDFSKAQVANLMTRNDLTQKLLSVTDTISQAHVSIPIRVAGERNRQYMLVKNDTEHGGGWVLGTRNVAAMNAGTAQQPLQLDSTTDASDTDSSAMEFEAVDIPAAPKVQQTPESAKRARQAIEALRQKFAPDAGPAPPDPYLDQVAVDSPNAPLFAETGLEDLDPAVIAAVADDPALRREIMWQRAQNGDGREATPTPAPTAAQSDADSDDDLGFVDVMNAPALPAKAPSIAAEESSEDEIEFVNVGPSAPRTPVKPSVARPLSPQAGIEAAKEAAVTNTRPQAVERHSSTGVTQRDYADQPKEPVEKPKEPVSKPATSPARPPARQAGMSASPASRPASTLAVPSSAPPSFVPLVQVPSPPLTRNGIMLGGIAASAFAQLDQPSFAQTDGDVNKSELEVEASEHIEEVAPAPEAPLATKPVSPPAPSPQPVASTSAKTLDDDEEEVIPWSRSPSPAARPTQPAAPIVEDPLFVPEDFPLAEAGHEFSDEEVEDEDDAAVRDALEEEQDQFSRLLNDLQTRNLDEMRDEAENEVRELAAQRKKDRRAADDVTLQMSQEIQAMLRLFGIPYVVAPMEAEAQCAELLARNLVDGIITDDSDVFLFGGSRIYKNMFNQNKYVECYLLADFERELSLDRSALIRLAHFLGSDYIDGLPGVGPVIAMELMSEFPGDDGLVKFREWWRKVQTGSDTAADTRSAFRRKFKKSKKELFLDDAWPNPAVKEAYLNPAVDSSTERFTWALPDLDGLRHFLAESLGWSMTKVDDLLKPLIKRMAERSHGVANMQGSLDRFFDTTVGTGSFKPHGKIGYKSARLQNVLKSWRDSQKRAQNGGDASTNSDSDDAPPPPKRPKPKRARSSKSSNGTSPAPRGKRKATAEADEEEGDDGGKPKRKPRPKRKAKKKATIPDDNSDDEDNDH